MVIVLLFLKMAAIPVIAQTTVRPDKIARAFIGAFNEQNPEKMISMTAKNVKWFTVSGAALMTETAGQDELRTFLTGYFKSCPTCRSRVRDVTVAGARVSMTETSSWKTDTGVQSMDSFAVYEFENGLIARVYYYETPGPNGYSERLAKKVGADERGMKVYVFAFLKSGKKAFEKEERARLVAGHMENIGRLAASRKLVLAGPFAENDALRGIYIFDVRTKEEAQKLVETDPAVAAGVFDVELRLWYGSAALLPLNDIHNAISRTNP